MPTPYAYILVYELGNDDRKTLPTTRVVSNLWRHGNHSYVILHISNLCMTNLNMDILALEHLRIRSWRLASSCLSVEYVNLFTFYERLTVQIFIYVPIYKFAHLRVHTPTHDSTHTLTHARTHARTRLLIVVDLTILFYFIYFIF